jgi:Glutaredoxin-like domain (DUF836)
LHTLILHSRPNCHLCEEAEGLLCFLGIAYSLIDIDDDVALGARYGLLIPVLSTQSGRDLPWPFDADQVQELLKEEQ